MHDSIFNLICNIVRTGFIKWHRIQLFIDVLHMKAYLFDVDGVLTDPKEKRVTKPEFFDQIIAILQRGEPVGLNTGRSIAWLVERFITPLIQNIEDKSLLQHFIAVGEKGGTWIIFDKEGNIHHEKMEELAISQDVIKEAKVLVERKYNDSMFFDLTKETMLSIEMHDGFELDMFHQRQKMLVEDLKQLLTKYKLQNIYHIDPTTIATDVESPNVGKALGADRFLKFLQEMKLEPQEFETFGDSKSDFGMSDELYRKGKQVRMIYVGDRSKFGESAREYPIDYVGEFSKGTLEYLEAHA